MSGSVKVAIVVQTHFYDKLIESFYRRLVSEVPENHTVFLLINCGDKAASNESARVEIGERCYPCNTAMLLAMHYPGKCCPNGWTGKGWTLNPGNTDLLILNFAETFREYDYYWGIEYDVHYEGSWKNFFNHFVPSQSDLLGTTLYQQQETPKKNLLPLQIDSAQKPVASSAALRGFFSDLPPKQASSRRNR